MKKTSLVALIAIALMLVSVFAPAVFSGPTQPPVDTSTAYIGSIAWGPADADPAQAYDTASGELLFNTYETLIQMGEDVSGLDVKEQYWAFEPLLATNVPIRHEVIMTFPDTGINPTDPYCYWFTGAIVTPPEFAVNPWYHICGWVDNNPDEVLGPSDVLYIGEYLAKEGEMVTCRTWQVLDFVPGVSVTVHHYYYDFNIRTDPVIYFVDNTGAIVGTFDIEDVEYTYERDLVFDMWHGPTWMFYKPLFDQMNSDWWGEDTSGNPAEAWCLAYLIEDAFEQFGDTLRINLGIAFPDIAFKQILTQMWGSILDKGWCIDKGLWDGNLFADANTNGWPDWFESFADGGWRHVDYTEDPIDVVDPTSYAGTGPYRVVVTSEGTGIVVLERNELYWQGWPARGVKSFLERVQIEYIADWATRREAFKACQLDVCAVPRGNILELLDPLDLARMRVGWGDPFVAHPEIITIKNISPTLAIDAIHFVFNCSNADGDLFTGTFPGGAPGDFFYNLNVRKAFAYALNRSKFLAEAWLGEAICRETVNPFGMSPDYYCYSPDPPWTYTKDLNMMKTLLEAAMFTQLNTTSQQIETHSLWAWGGFHIKMYYNAGNEPRRIACEFIKDSFIELNNMYGKSFLIDLVGANWSVILAKLWASTAPTYTIGWLADFADPDNFVRPYMHSYGDFSYFQKYWVSNGWATPGPRTGLNKDLLIDLGIKTPDGPEREAMYKDLDDIYIADCPSIPMAQALGRRWQKYWYKGWYYDALYPSSYYYKHYKEDACWADVTGPTIGVPDGVCNMRDIGYIAARFGAKAPDPSKVPPYDPKWAPGQYGCSGADVYGDRKVDMRDIGLACAHFGHKNKP